MTRRCLIALFSVTLMMTLAASLRAQDDPEVYVLGVALPSTGGFGELGEDFQDGIQLAVSQMNAQLRAAGRGIRFEIVSADTETTPEGADRALRTIVQTSDAQVVVGPVTTAEVMGLKPFADETGVVIVAPTSSGAAAAIPGDSIFRVIFPPDVFASKAYASIARERGHQNMVVLYVDDAYGRGMNEHFIADFQAGGGGDVTSIAYAPGAAELASEAAAISAALAGYGESAGFMCVCFLPGAQAFLQQARTDPIIKSARWLGNHSLISDDVLQDAELAQLLLERDYITVAFSSETTPLTGLFVDDFIAAYGVEPQVYTNYAFDAANIAMLTILMAGNDSGAVKSMLPFVSSHYIGTAVQAYLDANGDQAIASYGLYAVRGDLAGYEEIGAYDGNADTISYK